jgi:hypothetical protein
MTEMPQITGTVRCISVSDDAGFTTIDDPTAGTSETFILWFVPGTGGGIPSDLTSFTRILHSMWLSFLREAHANNLTITLIHPEGSAEVSSIRLGTF